MVKLSDAPSNSVDLPPMKLEAIECRSLDPGPWLVNDYLEDDEVISFIANLIQANCRTLRCLTIGQESQILRTVYKDPDSRSQDEGGVLQALASKMLLLNLSSLALLALNVHPAQAGSLSRSVELSCLRKLTLESCPGSAEFIQQLAATMPTDNSAEQTLLALSEFSFRYEAPEQTLIAALETFLVRINPLVHLSVLLDSTRTMPQVGRFIQKHGTTLKCLVWEGRIGQGSGQTPDSLGDIWDEDSEISAVLRHCPQLKELGVPLDWHTFCPVSDCLSSSLPTTIAYGA